VYKSHTDTLNIESSRQYLGTLPSLKKYIHFTINNFVPLGNFISC